MKKLILLFAVIFGLYSAAFAEETNLPYVVKDGYNDFTTTKTNEVTTPKLLDKIEAKILGKTYSNESPESRLNRIEALVFGAIQSGTNQKRINALNAYSNKYLISNSVSLGGMSTNYQGSGIMPRGIRGGTMTGYIPPINGYYPSRIPYNNYYYPNYGRWSGFRRWFNRGWFNNGFNNGFSFFRNPFNRNPYYAPNSYQWSNGYGINTIENSDSGASVTIIE